MKNFHEIEPATAVLFGKGTTLLPSVTEMFEYEMAYLEYNMLPKKELLERTAYIQNIGDKYSKHFLLYSNYTDTISENRSALTNAYFQTGQFATGYATHSLFPYRGKFHAQLIKGLLNILAIKKGETILDPMAGSGTTNIEAALTGIHSVAIDVSPFCQLMTQTKYDALTIDLNLLENTELKADELFQFFNKKTALKQLSKIEDKKKKIYHLALLAYLDALGYSKRVKTSNHKQLFNKVLNRYIETVKVLLKNPYFDTKGLGQLKILSKSDALNIELDDNSIDGIITSPPYSFAIDYVENDKDQLEYMGYDTTELKNNLIGLKGRYKRDKLASYFEDMDTFCCEAGRVLKKNKYLVIVIGSNTNQTGGIRLEKSVIDSANKYALPLVKSMMKTIKGIRNTMKEEYVLIFKKQ